MINLGEGEHLAMNQNLTTGDTWFFPYNFEYLFAGSDPVPVPLTWGLRREMRLKGQYDRQYKQDGL